MKALFLQNCPAEGAGLVAARLRERGVAVDAVHPYRGDPLPPAAAYAAFVVGGTPASANDAEHVAWLRAEWDYLREVVAADRPVLGLCFGGQVLARLLGAAVRRNPVQEIGGYQVRLTGDGRRDPLLDGFPRAFPVFQWHGETFDVPPGARLLVEGDACRNQLFRHGRLVGVQFHLEVTAEEAERWAAAYAGELREFGKSAADVVAECRAHEKAMRALAYRLVDNFVSLAG